MVITLPFAEKKVLAVNVTIIVLFAHGYGVLWPMVLEQKNGACTFSGSASPCSVI